MGADSKIEWTDHTFNPWIGCTKVSPAAITATPRRDKKGGDMAEWPADLRVRETPR